MYHNQNVTVANSSHNFSAEHMPRAARQAALASGLSTVARYQIVNHAEIISHDDTDQAETVVIVAESKAGRKQVEITAGDIFFYRSEYQDAPMARVG